jgi:hypothetical protein
VPIEDLSQSTIVRIENARGYMEYIDDKHNEAQKTIDEFKKLSEEERLLEKNDLSILYMKNLEERIIRNNEALEEKEIQIYKLQAGIIAKLIEVLNSKDLHHENIIFRGTQPFLIDLENSMAAYPYPLEIYKRLLLKDIGPYNRTKYSKNFINKKDGRYEWKELMIYRNPLLFQKSGDSFEPVPVNKDSLSDGSDLFEKSLILGKERIGEWFKTDITQKLISRELSFNTEDIAKLRFKTEEEIKIEFKNTKGELFPSTEKMPVFIFSNSVVMKSLAGGYIPAFYACVGETEIFDAMGSLIEFNEDNYLFEQVKNNKEFTFFQDFKKGDKYFKRPMKEEQLLRFENIWQKDIQTQGHQSTEEYVIGPSPGEPLQHELRLIKI